MSKHIEPGSSGTPIQCPPEGPNQPEKKSDDSSHPLSNGGFFPLSETNGNKYWREEFEDAWSPWYGPGRGYNPFFPPIKGAGTPFPTFQGKPPPPPPAHFTEAFTKERILLLSTNLNVRTEYLKMYPNAHLPTLRISPFNRTSDAFPPLPAEQRESRHSRTPSPESRDVSRQREHPLSPEQTYRQTPSRSRSFDSSQAASVSEWDQRSIDELTMPPPTPRKIQRTKNATNGTTNEKTNDKTNEKTNEKTNKQPEIQQTQPVSSISTGNEHRAGNEHNTNNSSTTRAQLEAQEEQEQEEDFEEDFDEDDFMDLDLERDPHSPHKLPAREDFNCPVSSESILEHERNANDSRHNSNNMGNNYQNKTLLNTGYIIHRTQPSYQSTPYMVVKTAQNKLYRINLPTADMSPRFRVLSPVEFYYHPNSPLTIPTPLFSRAGKTRMELPVGFDPEHITDTADDITHPSERAFICGTISTTVTKNNNTVDCININDADYPYPIIFVFPNNLANKILPKEGTQIHFATSVRTKGKKGNDEYNYVSHVEVDARAVHKKLTHIMPPFTLNALASSSKWRINTLIGDLSPDSLTSVPGIPTFEPSQEHKLDFSDKAPPLLLQMMLAIQERTHHLAQSHDPDKQHKYCSDILRYASVGREPLNVLINPYNFTGIKINDWPRLVAEYYTKESPFPNTTFHILHTIDFASNESNWLNINSFTNNYSTRYFNHTHNITMLHDHVSLGRFAFTQELVFNQSETQHKLAITTHKKTIMRDTISTNIDYDLAPPPPDDRSMAESLDMLNLTNLLLISHPTETDKDHLSNIHAFPNHTRYRPELGHKQLWLHAPDATKITETFTYLTGSSQQLTPIMAFPANAFFKPTDRHITIIFNTTPDINLLYAFLGKLYAQPISHNEIHIELPEHINYIQLKSELNRLNAYARKNHKNPPFLGTYRTTDTIDWLYRCKPEPTHLHTRTTGYGTTVHLGSNMGPGPIYVGGLSPILSTEVLTAALATLGIMNPTDPALEATWVRSDAGQGTLLCFLSQNRDAFLQIPPGTLGSIHPYPAQPPTAHQPIMRAFNRLSPNMMPDTTPASAYEPPMAAQLLLNTLKEALKASPLRPVTEPQQAADGLQPNQKPINEAVDSSSEEEQGGEVSDGADSNTSEAAGDASSSEEEANTTPARRRSSRLKELQGKESKTAKKKAKKKATKGSTSPSSSPSPLRSLSPNSSPIQTAARGLDFSSPSPADDGVGLGFTNRELQLLPTSPPPAPTTPALPNPTAPKPALKPPASITHLPSIDTSQAASQRAAPPIPPKPSALRSWLLTHTTPKKATTITHNTPMEVDEQHKKRTQHPTSTPLSTPTKANNPNTTSSPNKKKKKKRKKKQQPN